MDTCEIFVEKCFQGSFYINSIFILKHLSLNVDVLSIGKCQYWNNESVVMEMKYFSTWMTAVDRSYFYFLGNHVVVLINICRFCFGLYTYVKITDFDSQFDNLNMN